MRRLPPAVRVLKNCFVVVAIAVIVVAAQRSIGRIVLAQTQAPAATQAPAVSASPAPTPARATDWNKTVDSAQKLVAALGIVIGGFWAWLKFFRGRTFRSRLEIRVSANLIMTGTTKFLKATMEMKNVGLSQVKLKRDAIYLDLFLIDASRVKPASQLYSARWSEPVTFPVFADHGWVEPAEEISDELLLQLPDSEQLAGKLKLTVNSVGSSWLLFKGEGTRWSATTIINCLPQEPNQPATEEKGEKP